MTTVTEEGLTVSAYARLRGVPYTAVMHRITIGGWPTRAKRIHGKCRIVDVARADEEWESHTRPYVASTPSKLAEATMRERQARAEMFELRNAQSLEQLVRAQDVAGRWAALVIAARTLLLGLPTRARARLPHLTARDL